MAQHIFRQVWAAISNLNPQDVRTASGQGVLIGLHARNAEIYDQMESFLAPDNLSRERRLEVFGHVFRVDERDAPKRFDVELFEEGLPRPNGSYMFDAQYPQETVREVLETRENLALPMARLFPAFRKPVTDKIIHTVSRENAFFSLATALPDIIPSLIQLPWAIGEFASDTAFLTVNQVRMAFLLGAASDRSIGYSEQRSEIGSIMAGAFGWRTIARELVGKIPFGGGLIPKAAIAYAGTYVAGRVLDRLYQEGYEVSRKERRLAYESAFERGKRVASELLESFKVKQSAASGQPSAPK